MEVVEQLTICVDCGVLRLCPPFETIYKIKEINK
jgi:hypothetical protein